MSKQPISRTLLFLVCVVLLLLAMRKPAQMAEADVCKDTPARPETPQLLWESLSRPFVSSAQY